jgi:3-hydroxymyristoyl/3-hydroxydecanoyl-(acyl carrier protein) dehydratase
MIEPSPVLYTVRVEIPVDHPCFPGHFPGQPILPGVLLLQRVMALAQTSLVSPIDECTMHNIKFSASVAPGDVLDVQLTGTPSNEYRFTVRVVQGEGADGIVACSGLLRTRSS